MKNKLAVVAVGGNSLIKDKDHKSVEDQYQAVLETVRNLLPLIQKGYGLIMTHGNGPQVGFILRRSEIAMSELHAVPLDSCVADTQGAIGYMIQMAFANEFKKSGMDKQASTIVTQVLVDKDDPSFQKPSKPIGSFMSKEIAEERRDNMGWDIVEDSGRGFRRVVASPEPKKIIELDSIRSLVDNGFVVVAVGGGGVPVVENENGNLEGAAAVIDKDLASSLLAVEMNASPLIISTAVEKVCLNFGQPDQVELDKVTLAELKEYMEAGHFKPGSMLPKVQAVIRYIEGGGDHAIITDPANIDRALAEETGTHVYP